MVTAMIKSTFLATVFLFSSLLGATVEKPLKKLKFATSDAFYTDKLAETVFNPILKPYGYEIVIVDVPRKRSLIQSNNGDLDGEIARIEDISKLSKHKLDNLLRVNVSYAEFQVFGYSKIRSDSIKKWEDLAGYTVTVPRGAMLAESAIKSVLPFQEIIFCRSFRHGMKLLKSDRVDFLVSGIPDGPHIVDLEVAFSSSGPFFVYGPFHRDALFLYLHKKHKPLVEVVEKGLLELRESGKFEVMKNEVKELFKSQR